MIYRPSNIQILRTQDIEIIQILGRMRVEAWRDSGAKFRNNSISDSGTWLDNVDFSPMTFHFVAYDGKKIIGGARISMHLRFEDVPDSPAYEKFSHEITLPCVSFGRLFVANDYRGISLGFTLLSKSMEFAKTLPVQNAVSLGVGEGMRHRLERCGYKVIDVYDEDEDLICPTERFYVMYANMKNSAPQTRATESSIGAL